MRVRSSTGFSRSWVGRFASLLFESWDRHHVAMVWLAAQPTDEGTLQVISIKPVGLRPSMLA
jgi:hypothetical protein